MVWVVLAILKIVRELSHNEVPKFSSQDRIAANHRRYLRYFGGVCVWCMGCGVCVCLVLCVCVQGVRVSVVRSQTVSGHGLSIVKSLLDSHFQNEHRQTVSNTNCESERYTDTRNSKSTRTHTHQPQNNKHRTPPITHTRNTKSTPPHQHHTSTHKPTHQTQDPQTNTNQPHTQTPSTSIHT